ncbi:MAG: hypothetical protein OXF02_04275, partial [Simkaniaceae bacterium]|nr:hypothetical protein [Simkaniaceae bacterium]
MATQLGTVIASESAPEGPDGVPRACPEGAADTARKVAVTARNDLDEKIRLEGEELDRRLRISCRIIIADCLVGVPIACTVASLAGAFGGLLGLAIGTPVVGVSFVGVAVGATLYLICPRAGFRRFAEGLPEDCAEIWGCEERYKARRLKREAKSESDEKVVDAPPRREECLEKEPRPILEPILEEVGVEIEDGEEPVAETSFTEPVRQTVCDVEEVRERSVEVAIELPERDPETDPTRGQGWVGALGGLLLGTSVAKDEIYDHEEVDATGGSSEPETVESEATEQEERDVKVVI